MVLLKFNLDVPCKGKHCGIVHCAWGITQLDDLLVHSMFWWAGTGVT